VTPEQERLRDAYLSELWPVCREVPYGERAAKQQADWEQRVLMNMRPQPSTGYAPQSTDNGGDMHKSVAA
jgi:hypothetical protein